MKEITLKIPDKKLNFFLELVRQLGFEISEQIEIPEEHKKLVRERIRKSEPSDMLGWDELSKQLIVKK